MTSENKFIHITCNIILSCLALVVFCLSVFSPIMSVSSNGEERAFYSGNPSNKNVSLMINVYWGDEYLDKMLEILDKNQVKTTFFVGGCWVARNNENLLKIFNAGHEIGNHGYNHKDSKKLSAEMLREEIYSTCELVESLTGKKTTLFAPPSGSFNSNTLTTATAMGYKTIMWSKDTIDWRDKDENLIFTRATKNLKNGDLILMHPTLCTANCLDNIIKDIKSKGFNIVPVSKNIEGLV